MGLCNSKNKIDKEKLFEIVNGLFNEFMIKHCDFNKDYFEHADIVNTAFVTFILNNHAKKELNKAIQLGWVTNYPGVTKHISISLHPLTGEIMTQIDKVYVGMRIREFPKYVNTQSLP